MRSGRCARTRRGTGAGSAPPAGEAADGALAAGTALWLCAWTFPGWIPGQTATTSANG